ncbi:MAG: hypothetical protein JKX95_06365 [Bacteroidia bacterium]|nr:hypothetical protein [Bacteroidia bacterium]
MRKLTIAIIILTSSFYQGNAQLASKFENISKFKNTTLLVLLDNEEGTPYNTIVKNAIRKYWKFNDYKFIRGNQFEELVGKTEYSFLALITHTIERDGVESSKFYTYEIFLSENLEYEEGKLKSKKFVGEVFLEGYDEFKDFDFKLITFLQFMQNSLNYVLANQIKGSSWNKLKKHYTIRRAEIKQKTLLFTKEDLSKYLLENKVSKYYKHPYKIVDKLTIAKAIAEQDKTVAFVHIVSYGGANLNFVVEANGGNIMFLKSQQESSMNPVE